MHKYQLRFLEWEAPRSDTKLRAWFKVERGEVAQPLCLNITGTCAATSGITDVEELKEVLLRAGLRAARDLLQRGAFDTTPDTEAIDVTFSSLRVGELLAHRQKYCKYRRDTDLGPLCAIADPSEKIGGMTPVPLCEACEIPDSNLACMHLVHLMTQGSMTSGPNYTRLVTRFACNSGTSAFKPGQCVPGGGCGDWTQVVTVSPPDEAVPSDIVDRIVDEIDYLNLAFKDRYAARLVQLTQARTIGDLGIRCQEENDFTQLVAVVASVLAGIRVPENLLDNPDTAKDKGSLTKLEAFLGQYHPDYDKTRLQRLKSITRIRNSYPIHPKTEGVSAAFGCLSIEYPVRDWPEAGRRVLGALCEGLRHLRTLIQYSGQQDDEQD